MNLFRVSLRIVLVGTISQMCAFPCLGCTSTSTRLVGTIAQMCALPCLAGRTVFPGTVWKESTPESQGVDSTKLNEAMAYLAGKCGAQGTTQAVVIRYGCMIWKGSDVDNRHNVWSCTKSYTSTVLGLLIDDSKCTLDTLAKDHVPALADQYSGVKLRHFATMTSGYDAVGGSQSNTPFDPAAPLFAPGAEFRYWDSAMNQFGNTLTQIANEPIKDLFNRRIADPIGMTNWEWGNWGTIGGLLVHGGAGNKSKGIHIDAKDMARFGLLFLNRGNWSGRQLISASWVDKATSVQVPQTVPGSGSGIYGFNWWLYGVEHAGEPPCPAAPPRTYAALGHNNNRCLVIPEWDMVIVRLGLDGNTVDNDELNTFFEKIGDAINVPVAGTPAPGQIIVDPDNPRWLVRYNAGGNHTPFFMCGPGDPEDFLYRGTRNADGTRNGDQAALINKLKPTGANCIYLQAVRSHGGDGDATHNPFIDNDPTKGLNNNVLDQWESWFTEMDNAGIVIFFFFYDDSARIWDTGDTVCAAEKQFIQGLVNRFKHHRNLIWCVAEEYQERYSAQRVSNIAAEIRAADNQAHPIAVHKLSGLDFSEFADDPNIDQFAIQGGISTPAALHADMLATWANAGGRYNLNFSEGHTHGTGAAARKNSWACAMAGAYVMVYQMDIASTAVSDLNDCGRLVNFFESTNFQKMDPHDELAGADTEYVLARPPIEYIAYSSNRTGKMGIKADFDGTYTFKWLDCATGTSVTQSSVNISAVNPEFSPPAGFGTEVVVYIYDNDLIESTVVNRRVFYNNSAFDGNNPAANADDDGAIAPDKTALLPDGTATFANYTSFSRGINGIMVDISNLRGTPTTADFTFKAGNPLPTMTLLDANFDSGTDGLIYSDDTFRNTNQPAYASGSRISSGGFSGGALKVNIGGIDDDDIVGMSGGWRYTFTLSEASKVSLTLRYKLTQTANYESDEYSEALVSIDAQLVGTDGNDYLAKITGDGESGDPQTTGWKYVELDLGTLSTGDHTIIIGPYNNKKTAELESTEMLIDDVKVMADAALPDDWSVAPAPTSITVRNGAGTGGSDRITIVWADNAVQKQWLQVTVKATSATGLAGNDVFYFGNAIGETGNSATDAKVTPTDQVDTRNNPHTLGGNPAGIDDAYDFNRDKKVGPTDEIIARNNGTSSQTALKLITAP